MSYALIDNATLTGVQRLLGEIPIRSRDLVDADIAALENLVEAILLYDQIVTIDDYKEEFRAGRHARFPFIRFLQPDEFGLPEIRERAFEEASRLHPTIRGGEFVDEDFRSFLDTLTMHIVCTWNMQSSVFYLNMKMLGQPDTEEFRKYGELSAAIFGELVDLNRGAGEYSPQVELVDRYGKLIRPGYRVENSEGRDFNARVSGSLQAFVAALRWLAYRTIYYSHAATHLHGDLYLYPVRQAFHLHYMKKTGNYSQGFVSGIIDKLNTRVLSEVSTVLNANSASSISFSVPMFSAWLVREAGTVKSIIDTAFAIRDREEFDAARSQLREIGRLFREDGTARASQEVQRILSDLDRTLLQIREQYGIQTNRGWSLASIVKVINAGLALKGLPGLPEPADSLRLPDSLRMSLPKQGFAALYRDIGKDLADIASLGGLRDKLGDAVVLESGRAYSPASQDPKFVNAKSWWSVPM